jgi:hypothetical protein
MSESVLKLARQLIQQKEYAQAKAVLETIPDHPTAKAWLKRLQEIEPQIQPEAAPSIPTPVMLPLRQEVIIRKYVSKGEIVLSYEQPEPNIFARYLNPSWMIAIFVISGFALLAFQFYIQFRTIRLGITPLFYLQLATPLILIAAPFIRIPIAKRRANTIHYIITNRQGFIIENLKVKVLTAKDATRMEIVQERAGFTSLIFHRHSGWWNLIAIRLPEGFLGIADASKVKQVVSKYWRFNSVNK